MNKKIGPDGFTLGQWLSFDMTCWDKWRGKLPWHASRSQATAVQVKSYRNGMYTVTDAQGYRMRRS